jgi:hypothetical protein
MKRLRIFLLQLEDIEDQLLEVECTLEDNQMVMIVLHNLPSFRFFVSSLNISKRDTIYKELIGLLQQDEATICLQ